MGNFNQAPILKSKGQKSRNSKWGFAQRDHELESIIFNGLTGKQGAQIKLILFLTGNSDKGNFAVPEATVMSRCGMSETTYKSARKKLVEKGWIIHEPSKNGHQGAIVVDYDAIYKSAATVIDNTPENDIENTPSNSDNTSSGDNDNTHNNISNNINSNNKNLNTIKSNNPRVKDDFTDENGNFKF